MARIMARSISKNHPPAAFLGWYFSTTFFYHLCDLVLCLIVWFCFGKKGVTFVGVASVGGI